MKLAILAFPRFGNDDARLLESARAGRGNAFRRSLQLHFTLVFPTDWVEPGKLVEHTRRVAARLAEVVVTLDRAEIVWDSVGGQWLFQLVPSAGYD